MFNSIKNLGKNTAASYGGLLSDPQKMLMQLNPMSTLTSFLGSPLKYIKDNTVLNELMMPPEELEALRKRKAEAEMLKKSYIRGLI